MPKTKFHSTFQLKNIYTELEETCLKMSPKQDFQRLNSECLNLVEALRLLDQQVLKFHQQIEAFTVTSLILLWAKSASMIVSYGQKKIRCMIEIIENGIIPLCKNGSAILLREHADHEDIIEQIRLFHEWPNSKKEEAVQCYIDFSEWLSKASYGYVTPAQDLDREISKKRKVEFEKYLLLISHLALRERTLVKLFYFGGLLTIEDVFTLEIPALDFKKNQIKFPKTIINYPKHVLRDLKELIGERKIGPVFVNRIGSQVNHAVPYRILKSAARKIGLETSFTFRDLSLDN